MKTIKDDDCYTVAEVKALLASLDREDHARLAQIAKYRVSMSPGLESQELLNEAVVRVLEGVRGWPRGIDAIRVLDMAMKSIVNAELKHRKVVLDHAKREQQSLAGSVVNAATSPTMENGLHAEQLLDRIFGALSSDPEVLGVAMGRAEGMTGCEIQRQFNLSAKQYEAARRRYTRKITNIIPEE